jgi:hypothetical protein
MASEDMDAFATSKRLLSSGSAKCCLQCVQALANVYLSPILLSSIDAVDKDTVSRPLMVDSNHGSRA